MPLIPLGSAATSSASRGTARPELEVRLQALDGTWETCGVDRLRGIVPENFTASSTTWGNDKASFDLKRDPGGQYPDLTAFTPMEAWVGGYKCFSGRVSETPTREGDDRVVNVQCEGWQYHLDDDVYSRVYAHTRLADYTDARADVNANLTSFPAAYEVTSDGGIMLALPSAATAAASTQAGVTLDLGDGNVAKRVVVTYIGGGDANFRLRAYVSATSTGSDELWNVDVEPIATTSTTTANTFTTAARYVRFELANANVVTVTGTATSWVKLTSVLVVPDTTYESGNISALKASTVVADALAKGTILLSSSTDKITTTTFPIPSLALEDYRTPRQVIDGVNSYHDYLTQVDVDKKLVFGPKASVAAYEIGNWSGSEFEDASANNGDEVYNRVIVQAEGPDGSQLNVQRRQPTSVLETTYVSSPAIANPSFATDTSNWSARFGTLSRTTTVGEYDTAPGGAKVVPVANASTIVGATTGTFRAGATYTLTAKVRVSATTTDQYALVLGQGEYPSDYGGAVFVPTTTFQTFSVTWTPSQTYTSGAVAIFGANGVTTVNSFIDSLTLSLTIPTLVDRRGFRRTKVLPVSSALTTDAANQIGDVFLAGHKTTPLKGSIKISGYGVRKILGGEGVAPWKLLQAPGQQIRLSHRLDPDDGSFGRDGVIASVSYNHDANEASIDVDSTRGNFEALLSRLALIQGG
jgi:hypothetical protein